MRTQNVCHWTERGKFSTTSEPDQGCIVGGKLYHTWNVQVKHSDGLAVYNALCEHNHCVSLDFRSPFRVSR